MGTSRYVYNRTVDYFNNRNPDEPILKWNQVFNEINKNLPEWTKGVPYQVKKMAVKDCFNAFSNGCKALKRKQIKFFELSYRTKLDTSTSVYIPKTAVKQNGVYYTILGELKYKEKLPSVKADCRLVNMYGDYYLCVPHKTTIEKVDNQDVLKGAVSIDLGLRTFATFFSENSVGKIGTNAQTIITDLCFRLDKLCSEVSKLKKRREVNRKKRLKKVIKRLKCKLRNKIDELHKKTARFLCDNFSTIILPTFNVSNMVLKNTRKIRSKSVRSMMSLRFYSFRMYMRTKCKEVGIRLIECSEAYTSKTVSWNGELKEKLGSSKEIEDCGVRMDRDYNGARGIFLLATSSYATSG